MSDEEDQALRIQRYKEDLENMAEASGEYAAQMDEAGDGWTVWNVKAGGPVRKCGTRDEAIVEANRLNAQRSAKSASEGN